MCCGPKSKDFWPKVQSFQTNKGHICKKETILSENDVLITKPDGVCDIFNNYFVNVAKHIGNNCTKVDDAHPSIVEIKNNPHDLALEKFSFSEIDEEFVGKTYQ